MPHRDKNGSPKTSPLPISCGRGSSKNRTSNISSSSDSLSASNSINSLEGFRQDDDGMKDRVTINLKKSDLRHVCFALAPNVFTYKSDMYCMISLKLHPSFCKEHHINLIISNDGWRATLSLTVPKSYMEPKNILGADIPEDHVLYDAVKTEIFRLQQHFEKRPKYLLQLNLPFPAEPKTADDIFGPGSGQTANLIPLLNSKTNKDPEADFFTGNAVFFFQKARKFFSFEYPHSLSFT